MTNSEILNYERLTTLREKQNGGLNIGDAIRLGILERKREIEASDWKVLRDGTMTHEDPYYCIEGSRLRENWLEHMRAKSWVRMDTFVEAYIRACYSAGVKTVDISY